MTTPHTPAPSTPTAAKAPKPPKLLRVTFALSVIYIAGTVIGTLMLVVQALLSEDTVDVTIPLAQFWPQLYPGVEVTGPTAEIVRGGITTATVEMAGLGMDARLFLAGGYLVQGITLVLIGIAVATVCSRLGTDTPFAGAVTHSVRLAGASIMIGGITWQVLLNVGGLIAAGQALNVTGSTAVTDLLPGNGEPVGRTGTGWPDPGTFSLELWPIWLGLALLAVAAAFQYGDRLQRERELLQADNDRLLRDTDGLV